MPQAADITVKKWDGVTDQIYTLIAASSGDSSPAYWRLDTGVNAAVPIGLRRTFSAVAKWNGPRTARHFDTSYLSPFLFQDTTTSLYGAKDRFVGQSHFVIPIALSATEIQEGVAQYCNLLAATLMKQSAASGYSPT